MRVFSGKKSNMEFMLNGPRLQVSLIRGFQDNGALGDGWSTSYGAPTGTIIYTSETNNNAFDNYLRLFQMADGRQLVRPAYAGTFTAENFLAQGRFALKTKTADTYIMVTFFRMDMEPTQGYSWVSFERCKLGKGAWAEFATQQTLEVDLPTDKWMFANAVLSNFPSTNNNTWVRTSSSTQWVYSTPTVDTNWLTNSNSRVGLTVSGTTATLSITFPASYRTVLHKNNNTPGVCVFPCDIGDLQYATPFESINSRSASSNDIPFVQKVYSPYKKCMCLKSYLNGEIPIFNE